MPHAPVVSALVGAALVLTMASAPAHAAAPCGGRVGTALRDEAFARHVRAQRLREAFRMGPAVQTGERGVADPPAPPTYVSAYLAASECYRAWLAREPRTPAAYELRFFFAATLDGAGRLAEAAEVFEAVRDDTSDARYRDLAALAAVQARRALRADPPRVPTASDAAELLVHPPSAIRYPATVSAWLDAVDRYLALVPVAEERRALMVESAFIAFRYFQWDQARVRLRAVVDTYPEDCDATHALEALALIATIARDDEALRWLKSRPQPACAWR